VLVSFGDQIGFEDTLDAALDSVFGGDSGANAGDENVPVSSDPVDPDAPAEPESPVDPGTPTAPGAPGDNPDLRAALEDARQALADRQAAYASNDLVAAAQADEALQDAIERAIAASP
jgi:hypothetical protein